VFFLSRGIKKMTELSLPKIIIYDLDGTIIDTTKLHEEGWKHAFEKLGQPNKFGKLELPEGFLQYQKGRTGELAAKYVYGDDAKPEVLKAFRSIKSGYVEDKIGDSPTFPGFTIAHDVYKLFSQGAVWVCTSAPQNQVESVLKKNSDLEKRLAGKVVFKGMFKESKPSAEPLLVTLQTAGGFRPSEAIYVGDAQSDYGSAVNAGTGFIYFCPPTETIDANIPTNVPRIQNHLRIFDAIHKLNRTNRRYS
jgi:beta-phosphoglucomutase